MVEKLVIVEISFFPFVYEENEFRHRKLIKFDNWFLFLLFHYNKNKNKYLKIGSKHTATASSNTATDRKFVNVPFMNQLSIRDPNIIIINCFSFFTLFIHSIKLLCVLLVIIIVVWFHIIGDTDGHIRILKTWRKKKRNQFIHWMTFLMLSLLLFISSH